MADNSAWLAMLYVNEEANTLIETHLSDAKRSLCRVVRETEVGAHVGIGGGNERKG